MKAVFQAMLRYFIQIIPSPLSLCPQSGTLQVIINPVFNPITPSPMYMTICLLLLCLIWRNVCVHLFSRLKTICAFIAIIWEYQVYVHDQIGKFGCSPALESVLNYWPVIKHI